MAKTAGAAEAMLMTMHNNPPADLHTAPLPSRLNAAALAVAMALDLIDRTERQPRWISSRRVRSFPRGQPAAVKARRAIIKRRLRACMEADARYWRPYWAFNPELGYDTSNVTLLHSAMQWQPAPA